MSAPHVHPAAGELPLAGWRIIVSRAKKQAGSLVGELRQQGADVLEIPFIEIRPPRSKQPMNAALARIAEYEWLILTSVNGVEAFFARVRELSMSDSELAHLKIAAIGPATKAAIERHGLQVHVTPREYVAESIVESLAGEVRGSRVLLCRAKIARDVIPRELRKLGALVEVVEAYETVSPKNSREQLRAALKSSNARPDAITFTSSSTVRNYLKLLGVRSGKSKLLAGVRNVSIGPVTSDTLRRVGLTVDVQAREFTIPGLIEALVDYAKQHPAKRE